MKYSLDLNIVCNDQTTLDSIRTVIPPQTDDRVWDVEYYPVRELNDNSGNKILTASVRFHDIADRDAVNDTVVQIQGMLTLCEVGTWIRLLICHHDPATELKGCEGEVLYEVVE